MALNTTQDSAQHYGESVDIIDAEAITVTGEVMTEPTVVAIPEPVLAAPRPRTLATKAQDPFESFGYDPAAIATHYRRRPFQVWARFVGIFLPLISFFAQLWLDARAGRSAENEIKRAAQLRTMLTNLGPAYIKIGQALSTRPDLVPPLFLEELTKLQDQIPPFPNVTAYRFIEEELGAPPSQIYAEISENPIAAASLGQVYKGKLHSGEDVAIKVQRPGLARNIALDLHILRGLARFATNRISQIRSDLVAILDEFGERIFEEMDYTHEGENAQRFASLYNHIPDIYVPHIYPQYTARRVLTMEWIEGTKLTNVDKLDSLGIDATHLIDVGVQCSLRQLLEHGFFHADPHPGNLLAMADGKLAYLDFGMMSEVKPYQRYGLIEAVVHMVNRDFEGLANDYVKLEFLTPDTDLTPIIPALANVFSNALGASVAELNFKSITDEFSALMYEYPFRVPAYYALIIRSLVTLEGIAINVDPEFKVLSKAYPYVAKRLLTDQSPELRASLQDLLFKDGSFRWNRLENLLRNARSSDDYDMDRLIDQTLEFLFSDRGSFLRDRIVGELVNSLDNFGQSTVQNLTTAVQRRFGLKKDLPPAAAAAPNDLDNLRRILDILKDTPGFDAAQVATRIPTLLFKPETQAMGQQVVAKLAQRGLARLIRNLLLEGEPVAQPQLTPSRVGG
ncbi:MULTISPECIES: ABC1 kinase family protein [Cyanophyceae]|uniref:AarF/ABC1/UbiB kinase family protein n=1 Tax=Leptolyngbya subtilissima DQ-A4 TaxID=2933933 RepID=A0ABV0K7C2_9CYAN|nr:AarF/ABC1/UbiB kinase family protein [Nodosilinea sp. FACHB-141]MBD2113979.1 AarF/ABC1/UbiB kinase family protein [Nodosilinea sp. FACHB-141]